MARKRDRFGRFLKKTRSNPARKSSRRSKAVTRYSKPRKNVYFGNAPKKHRRPRRNPPMFGGGRILGMNINDILYAGAGFIAPPALEGVVKGFLPATITANVIGKWAIKVGAVAGVSMIGGKFLGREAGKYLAIGGATYLLASAIVQYVPALFSGFSGYMNPGRVLNPAPARAGMTGQPFIGRYLGAAGSSIALANVPSRLDAASRL